MHTSAAASAAVPHATTHPPCSCFAGRGRREVAELLASSSAPSHDHTSLQTSYSSLTLNAGELLRQQNSSCPLTFRATRAPLQLHQDLSNRLHPLVQALTVPSPGYVRSSSTPAETAVSTSCGQGSFKLIRIFRVGPHDHGEPLILPNPPFYGLSSPRSGCLVGRHRCPPWPWSGSSESGRTSTEGGERCAGA